MPMWRCPHCGTPQQETARCWVCRRSSTACGTCQNFRNSVAGQLGYCGLDRQRRPLKGDEIRACWEARRVVVETPNAGSASARPVSPPAMAGRTSVRRLEFVDVQSGPPTGTVPAGSPSTAAPDPGWSLWGDAEL